MFSLVVLPDVQSYVDKRLNLVNVLFGVNDQSDCFRAQVEWIVKNQDALQIKMVVSEGDLTQSNDVAEWKLTEEILSRLDNVVPYILCVGNHDQGYDADPPPHMAYVSARRDSLINEYFPPSRFEKNPRYQYCSNFNESTENYCLFFDADDLHFMIVSLEYKPRGEVLAWANRVVNENPDRRCIILTHGFLNCDAQRDLRGAHYLIEGSSAQDIWDKFVCQHKNIFLLLCGHEYGEAFRVDEGLHGNRVYQIMANYQWWENGGNGWLRIMTFLPEENRMTCSTYSPVLDVYRRAPSSEFELYYDMNGWERAPVKRLSIFQKRKLQHYFYLMDQDKNGCIDQADLFRVRDRMANMRGMLVDSPAYKQLTKIQIGAWEFLAQINGSAKDRVTFTDIIRFWDATSISVADSSEAEQAVIAAFDAAADDWFAILDGNGDQRIGFVEFLLFLKAVGVHSGHGAAFARLAPHENGLTLDAFRLAMREFFLGDDPNAPGTWIYGLYDTALRPT